MQKSRITNLSTRFLWLYKNGILIVLIGFLGTLLYQVMVQPTFIIMAASWCWIIWKYYQMNGNVFHVEFDDEFLYLIHKQQDTLIPLQNIKEVTLKTMGGLYEIELYHPELVGDKIYYKPSLLYPFNFKAKDKIADMLRDKIEKAKLRPDVFPKNTLMS